jgi:hypothetical protein
METISLASHSQNSIGKSEVVGISGGKTQEDQPEIEEQSPSFIERSDDPYTQLTNLRKFFENLVEIADVRSALLQITLDECMRLQHFFHSDPLRLYFRLILDQRERLHFAQVAELVSSEDQRKKIRGTLVAMNAVAKKLSAEDVAGTKKDEGELTIQKITEMLLRNNQNANKTAAVTLVSQILGEKAVEVQRRADFHAEKGPKQRGKESSPQVATAESTNNVQQASFSELGYLLSPPAQKNAQEVAQEIAQPQPWLNMQREVDFASVLGFFNVLYEKDPETRMSFKEWFVTNFNSAFRLENEKAIRMDDISSLVFRDCQAQKASEIAGMNIQRPVFLFADGMQYFRVLEKITGEKVTSSAMVLNLEGDTSNILIRTGFIFASRENPVELGHEIWHTIDPYLSVRKGYDAVLTEAFAFYWANKNDRQGYKKLLQNYYAEFTAEEQTAQKGLAEYQELVSQVVEKILALTDQLGEVIALRNFVQYQSVETFVNQHA